MNNKEYLFETIGDMDDDLIDDAAVMRPKRKLWPLVAAAACAAAMLLVILSAVNDQPDPVEPAQLHTAENLWLKHDFAAFSLSYSPVEGQTLSYTTGNYGVHFLSTTTTQLTNGLPVLQTTPLVIPGDQTLALEALVGRRYIAYTSEKGYPVFYDTQTDSLVDLQERILGDTNGVFLTLMKNIELRAQQDYPGFLNSDTNRRILWEYVYYMSRGLPMDDVRKQRPDTDFMQYYDGYKYKNDEEREIAFWDFCLDLFINTERTEQKKDYSIQVLGIDPIGGSCIIRVSDVYGLELYYLRYDIVTDTCTRISDTSGMRTIYNTSGYEFSYSHDGSIAAAHYPKVNAYSSNPLGDYIKRYEYPSYDCWIGKYEGEEVRLYLLNDNNRAITVHGPLASSKVHFADDSSVIYYRVMPEECKGRSGHFIDMLWYDRLNITTHDSDQWAFYPLKDLEQLDQVSDPIILQGKVVRLAASNTVAIMERGGTYYAYSLEDGRDVTQDIREDRISMYLHEQYVCRLEDGILYRANIFKGGEPEVLGEADAFHMSNDGAFAFVYQSGDVYVTCINVVTKESCIIHIDEQLAEQFLKAQNAKIRMTYTDHDNTLLLSFYVETETRQHMDLYAALKELPPIKDFEIIPEDPVVVQDLKAPQWVVDGYRQAAAKYEHASVGEQIRYSYYPAFAPRFTDGEDLFACLGLEKPEPFSHLRGTRYILFENGSESLILEYYVGWGLFDYDHDLAGVRILYNNGTREYVFLYVPEFSKPVEDPVIPDIDLPFEIPVEIPEPEKPYEQVVLPQIHKPGAPYWEPAENYGIAVFTEEALRALVLEIGEEDVNEILLYMEKILERKDFTPHAKAQIKDTVTQLMWFYPNYQTMFAFLDPMDTKTFICSAFLDVLDEYVDQICFPCEHGSNSYDGESRTLHLQLTKEAPTNAVNLIYAVTKLPYLGSLREGMADLYAMTMIGSFQYSNFGAFYYGPLMRFEDPNAAGKYLYFASGGLSGNTINYFANTYFRLYALTDTETMHGYLEPNSDVLGQYVMKHYGAEGYQYVSNHKYTDYEKALAAEKLFLKLFLQRLEEVQTQEEMLSYLQLYRVYRKLFCLIYRQEEVEVVNGCNQLNVLEIPHPELDYRSADAKVAEAALRFGIIKQGTLTDAQAKELLMQLIGRREYTDYDDYRHNHTQMDYDVFLIGDLRYKVLVFPGETIYRVENYTYGFSYTISAPH